MNSMEDIISDAGLMPQYSQLLAAADSELRTNGLKNLKLTDSQLQELQTFFNSISIDIESLVSYAYDPNPYAIESPAYCCTSGASWDLEEELLKRFAKYTQLLLLDSLAGYTSVPEEQEDFPAEMTAQAIKAGWCFVCERK